MWKTAGGLWNLSVGEEHKGVIVEAGSIKALVDLILKWSNDDDGVLELAAVALAILAADDKCRMEIVVTGGVHALVMLARNCKFEGVQEQLAVEQCPLWNKVCFYKLAVEGSLPAANRLSSSGGYESVLEEKAFFRPLEDLDKPQHS